MSNSHTCLFSLVVLCLRSVCCAELYIEQGKASSPMSCGNARSEDIQWMYNSQLIIKENKWGTQVKGSSVPVASRARMSGSNLLISSIKSEDAGSYKCENARSRSTVVEHQLYVVSASASPSAAVLQGTKVELHCRISTGSSANRTWYRPDGTPTGTSKTGSFTLAAVEASDDGKWTCLINSEHKIPLRITVQSLRSSPILEVSQGESVLLPCVHLEGSEKKAVNADRFQQGGWERLSPVSAPLLSLEKKDRQLVWNSTSARGGGLLFERDKLNGNFSVTLRKVTVQQSGQYRCFLKFQDKGTLSAEVTLEVKGQPGGQPKEGPGASGVLVHSKDGLLGLSLWVWLAIGASCLVLPVLIGVTVCLSRRNKRMKRRARKLRSMRQPLTVRDYCQCNRGALDRPNGRRGDSPPGKESRRRGGGHGAKPGEKGAA